MYRRSKHVELAREPRRIELGARVLEFDDERVPFERLISTLPLNALLGLIEPLPSDVREAASRLRATHLYYLDVALERPPRTDFHWAYVPEAKYPFYRVGCYTHFSPDLAPPGAGSARCRGRPPAGRCPFRPARRRGPFYRLDRARRTYSRPSI
jgi:protoporphyrinogen oxidase